MLRINLLPAYILERRKTRMAIVGFSLLFAAVTVIMLGWFITLSGQVSERQRQADEQEQLANQVKQLEASAASTRQSIGPIKAKTDFVNAVLFYNTLRPRIFRNVAAYTYQNVEYNQMTIQGQTLTINAWSRNVSDVGRFLITMFANPDLSAVSVSGIPGWPPAAAGAPGQGGSGGEMSGSGMGPGPGGSDMAPPPGMGGGPTMAPPGGSGSEGAPGAAGGGAAGFNPYFDPNNPYASLGIPQAPPPPPRRGFPFTVTALLIKPLTPPSPPGAAPAAGAPGMSGMPGEMGSSAPAGPGV